MPKPLIWFRVEPNRWQYVLGRTLILGEVYGIAPTYWRTTDYSRGERALVLEPGKSRLAAQQLLESSVSLSPFFY